MPALRTESGHSSSVDQNTNRQHLLCIDDNRKITRAIQLRLKRLGVTVSQATTGRDGLRLAFLERPQVIMTDIAMPDGGGEFVVERLKANPETADIPVIVFSGITDRRLEARMFRCGVSAVLRKPVSFQTLQEHIAKFLNLTADTPSHLELPKEPAEDAKTLNPDLQLGHRVLRRVNRPDLRFDLPGRGHLESTPHLPLPRIR